MNINEMTFDSRAYCKGKLKKYTLGVFGSRTLNCNTVNAIIHECIKKLQPTKIVTSQEPQGVCEVAQRVAKDLAIPLQLHFINMTYLRGAFEQRSIEVISEADYMLFIHDGQSKGTANEIEVCKKLNKPYELHVIEVDNLAKNVGFNISQEWNKKNNPTLDNEIDWFS